jgi:hypothetical protein
MFNKTLTLVAGAAGYVLGARAGRERYDQIKEQADRLMNNPQVQKAASDVQDVVAEKAPIVKDKVADKVKKSDDSGSTGINDLPGTASNPATGGSTANSAASKPSQANV